MDYQSNSHNKDEKEQKDNKKIEKVISGEIVTRKKPLGKRFKEIFFGGEFKGAARYVAADVLLPAFRNLVVDGVTKGVERVIYGESSSRRRAIDYRSRTQYNNFFAREREPRGRGYLPDQPPYPGPRELRREKREIEEIILSSRQEAELVLERLTDIIDMYEVASVADLKDLLGITTNHVDNKWGWTFLNNVEVRQIREGYLIDLPYPEVI